MTENDISLLIESMLEVITEQADMEDERTRMVVAEALMYFGENPYDELSITDLLGVTTH